MRSLLERTKVLSNSHSQQKCLDGRRVFANPIQSVVLISALYGGWSKFEDWLATQHLQAGERNAGIEVSHVSWGEEASATEQGQHCAKRKPQLEERKRLDKYFKRYSSRYAERRRENPDATHSAIMRRLAGKARLVLTRESLEAAGIDVAPTMKRTFRLKGLALTSPEVQSHGSLDKYYEVIDRDLSRSIREKRKNLLRARFPQRITKATLTHGHRYAQYLSIASQYLPKATAALDRSVESEKAFRGRMLGPRKRLRKRHPSKRASEVGVAAPRLSLVQAFAGAPSTISKEVSS